MDVQARAATRAWWVNWVEDGRRRMLLRAAWTQWRVVVWIYVQVVELLDEALLLRVDVARVHELKFQHSLGVFPGENPIEFLACDERELTARTHR